MNQEHLTGTASSVSERATVKRSFSADPDKAKHYRRFLERAFERKGEVGGMSEALSMQLAVFAFLVGRFSIEAASRMISGALQDMIGQALVKRAADIQAGRRAPMKAEELADG